MVKNKNEKEKKKREEEQVACAVIGGAWGRCQAVRGFSNPGETPRTFHPSLPSLILSCIGPLSTAVPICSCLPLNLKCLMLFSSLPYPPFSLSLSLSPNSYLIILSLTYPSTSTFLNF